MAVVVDKRIEIWLLVTLPAIKHLFFDKLIGVRNMHKNKKNGHESIVR